jgi:hypothetical protein
MRRFHFFAFDGFINVNILRLSNVFDTVFDVVSGTHRTTPDGDGIRTDGDGKSKLCK